MPELLPGVNFFPRKDAPFYSIQLVLGVVPDLFYRDGKYLPSSPAYQQSTFVVSSTDWHTTQGHQKKESLEVKLPALPADESHTLLLSVGVRYGVARTDGPMEQLRHAGCAKVLSVA